MSNRTKIRGRRNYLLTLPVIIDNQEDWYINVGEGWFIFFFFSYQVGVVKNVAAEMTWVQHLLDPPALLLYLLTPYWCVNFSANTYYEKKNDSFLFLIFKMGVIRSASKKRRIKFSSFFEVTSLLSPYARPFVLLIISIFTFFKLDRGKLRSSHSYHFTSFFSFLSSE